MKKFIALFVCALTCFSSAHAGMHSGSDGAPLPKKTIEKSVDLAEGKLVLSLISQETKAIDITSAVAAGFKVVAIEIYEEPSSPQCPGIRHRDF